MSIPPLVCSTPPPPDQCEEDKDPEDFDLHYNLSQEDDYDYGSFSTYNHFQSAISVNKQLNDPIVDSTSSNNVSNGNNSETVQNTTNNEPLQWTNETVKKVLEPDQNKEIDVKINNDLEIDFENKINIEEQQNREEVNNEHKLHTDKKLNNEEELSIEDLNLTIEDDSLSSVIKNGDFDDIADSDKSHSSDKMSPHIPDSTNSIITSDPNEIVLDEISVPPPSIDIDDPLNAIDDLKVDGEEFTEFTDVKNEPEQSFDTAHPVETQGPETFKEVISDVNNETDDEFGDFNDFCSVTDSKAPSAVVTCDNPWEANQSDSELGTFEAHFDDAETNEPTQLEHSRTETERSAPAVQLDHNVPEDDDDFGDFDDFKSSGEDKRDSEVMQNPLSQVPVLDFQTTESESQILENINKILNSIFEEDIPEPEEMFEGKLETHLCETWGHLLETDVRQPYIVNWNSSIGQNTLLKALCIDSRNILFGPKWSYNMPKYAANLSVAPLQPQKQSTPSNQTEVNSDRNTTKAPGAWTDPFTSDGQESCNKENSAPEQKRPTDLDVFDTPLPTKSDKIYSSTLGVQPIRQISLPDTHIFTPTDSETPRSKTIHYDGPTVFLPTSIDSERKPTDVAVEGTTDNNILDDADYSDFQDFKGSFKTAALEAIPAAVLPADSIEPSNTNQLPSTSSTYSVGILQPIKIEPIMPTLNWPSPGEVKETFDDFTEFASGTTWNNDSQETHTPNKDVEKTRQINIMTDSVIKHKEGTPSKINDSFDDDFDTFQSALPSNPPNQMAPSTSDFSNFVATDFSQNKSTFGTSSQEPEMDFVFPKIENKSEPISLSKPYDILNNSEPFMLQNNAALSMPKAKESVAKVPPSQPTVPPPASAVLQPTVTATQMQQNSAQILQPLSLESFSQINWPNPGINLQDLSRFNPVETLNSLKSDLSVAGNSKGASPVHAAKGSVQNQTPEDDIWGEFVSSKPKPQQPLPKKTATFADDDEWTEFVSSPSVKPQNGLNTISFNVHTNLSMQKTSTHAKQNVKALEIPITQYITPKTNSHSSYSDRHFQNL